MRLKFNRPEEFISELRQSPPNAEPVLRATIRHQLDRHTGAFRHLTVIATYLRVLDGTPHPVSLVVTLENYQGEDWGQGVKGSEQTRESAQEVLQRLRAAATELGIECRSGVYEP
jgi:hypothetical protein